MTLLAKRRHKAWEPEIHLLDAGEHGSRPQRHARDWNLGKLAIPIKELSSGRSRRRQGGKWRVGIWPARPIDLWWMRARRLCCLMAAGAGETTALLPWAGGSLVAQIKRTELVPAGMKPDVTECCDQTIRRERFSRFGDHLFHAERPPRATSCRAVSRLRLAVPRAAPQSGRRSGRHASGSWQMSTVE